MKSNITTPRKTLSRISSALLHAPSRGIAWLSFINKLSSPCILTVIVFLEMISVRASEITQPEPGTNISGSVTFAWIQGPGKYYIDVGTTDGGSDLHAMWNVWPYTALPNEQTTLTVFAIPSGHPVYVTLHAETGLNTGYYKTTKAIYNADYDEDLVLDSIDPHPGVKDEPIVLNGSMGKLTINGSRRIAVWESAEMTQNAVNGTIPYGDFAKEMYKVFLDEFDFIIISSPDIVQKNPRYLGEYSSTQNSVIGLGRSLFNNSISYGSAGKLQGVMHLATKNGLRGGRVCTN